MSCRKNWVEIEDIWYNLDFISEFFVQENPNGKVWQVKMSQESSSFQIEGPTFSTEREAKNFIAELLFGKY